MKKILTLIIVLLGLTFADMIKDHAYVISAIGIKNINGEIAYISGSTNTPNVDGSYNLVPQVIIYDGSTSYVGAATPFTGCIGDNYYFDSEKKGSCFMGGAMKGATASANGESGLVPAPAAGQQSLFLRGDGTWAAPEGKNYSNATTSTSGLMSAADKTKLDSLEERFYTESEIDAKLNVLSGKLVDKIYPIGSIYVSVSETSPASLFGGTWERIKDTFLLSAGDTYTAGSTGGEAKHTLTVDEMPSHNHVGLNIDDVYAFGWDIGSDYGIDVMREFMYDNIGGTSDRIKTSYTGNSQAHNNMPPYLAVYMWKRTA